MSDKKQAAAAPGPKLTSTTTKTTTTTTRIDRTCPTAGRTLSEIRRLKDELHAAKQLLREADQMIAMIPAGTAPPSVMTIITATRDSQASRLAEALKRFREVTRGFEKDRHHRRTSHTKKQ